MFGLLILRMKNKWSIDPSRCQLMSVNATGAIEAQTTAFCFVVLAIAGFSNSSIICKFLKFQR